MNEYQWIAIFVMPSVAWLVGFWVGWIYGRQDERMRRWRETHRG